jgi:hypothetical protein
VCVPRQRDVLQVAALSAESGAGRESALALCGVAAFQHGSQAHLSCLDVLCSLRCIGIVFDQPACSPPFLVQHGDTLNNYMAALY